jgi:hypothetical protein
MAETQIWGFALAKSRVFSPGFRSIASRLKSVLQRHAAGPAAHSASDPRPVEGIGH